MLIKSNILEIIPVGGKKVEEKVDNGSQGEWNPWKGVVYLLILLGFFLFGSKTGKDHAPNPWVPGKVADLEVGRVHKLKGTPIFLDDESAVWISVQKMGELKSNSRDGEGPRWIFVKLEEVEDLQIGAFKKAQWVIRLPGGNVRAK